MNTRKLFEKIITDQNQIKTSNGYVLSNGDNLIEGIEPYLYESDLKSGSGNELASKFNAIYSSSALVVNSFAFLKNLKRFELLGYNDFEKINFERKFTTGLGGTAPNLDVVLENNSALLAFESKYLELLQKKKVHFSESYNKDKLKYLSDFWFSLIDSYKGQYLYLDVAQLIKHSIGLINYKRQINKKINLIYIYWTPLNDSDFSEYEIHKQELYDFTTRLQNQTDINFNAMTYNELWNIFDLNKELKNFSRILRDRYQIIIK